MRHTARNEFYLGAVLFLLLLFVAVSGKAADVAPTSFQFHDQWRYQWSLLSAAKTSTGDSNTAIDVSFCTHKVLEIKTSGTVSMTAAIKEGPNAVTVSTIPLVTAGTTRYNTTHYIDSLYVTFTIATGQVDSVILRCN